MSINVTVWNENYHEGIDPKVKKIYPRGIHNQIADFLNTESDIKVKTATLAEPEHGLTIETLNNTDVLIWWGHAKHEDVKDEVVKRVYKRIMDGMGFISLHLSHASKIFCRLCGTDSNLLSWNESGELERVFIINPAHPIAANLPEYFEIPHTEMYGEYFNIPNPDEIVFISWFKGGEVFRSGFTYYRGKGKIFYFRAGHETYPIYKQKEVQTLLINAVRWANPSKALPQITYRVGMDLNDLR